MPPGILYVVATPIGNLADWSPRARDVVAAADVVLVEDTRVSHKLFESFGLKPHVRVYEKHRERREIRPVLDLLHAGKTIALLSDAGTPAVADPGAALVAAALDEDIRVVTVPGPSILSAALSVAGIEEPPVVFHGYPPEKTGERRALIDDMRAEPAAHVILIPPHDAASILTLLAAALPTRRMVLCRELTKVHENVYAGTADAIRRRLDETEAHRGEMALVIHGPSPAAAESEIADLVAEARRLAATSNLWGKDLSDFLAFKSGVPRKTAYRAVQALKDEREP